jgi:hypothetical protein
MLSFNQNNRYSSAPATPHRGVITFVCLLLLEMSDSECNDSGLAGCSMKTIMCYGDSLTWGYDPRNGSRFPFDQRWPGVLERDRGYHLTPSDIASGCLALIWTIEKSQSGPLGESPEILLIAPPALGLLSGIMELFYKGSEHASRGLAKAYKIVAESSGCYFLDASKYVKASKVDGVHLDAEGHRILAKEIHKIVLPILQENKTKE